MTAVTAETLDERIVNATIHALELQSIHLGRSLGLYARLTEPRTVAELATQAGIDPRYAREWLEQQAVAGFISVDASTAQGGDDGWDHRRYHLDPHQRAVLLTPDDPQHAAPLADMVAGVGTVLDRLADAYLSGDGVPYAVYGDAFRNGQAGINRPAFTHDLTGSWLHAVPAVAGRLALGGRIADLGCGAGWSTIALAREFPAAEVVGVDTDPASIDDAVSNAAAAGVDVRFELADAAELASGDPYDLVVILESLHDMARPVEVLAAVREALAPGGTVLVADEKVAARFLSGPRSC